MTLKRQIGDRVRCGVIQFADTNPVKLTSALERHESITQLYFIAARGNNSINGGVFIGDSFQQPYQLYPQLEKARRIDCSRLGDIWVRGPVGEAIWYLAIWTTGEIQRPRKP